MKRIRFEDLPEEEQEMFSLGGEELSNYRRKKKKEIKKQIKKMKHED